MDGKTTFILLALVATALAQNGPAIAKSFGASIQI
jgi:hypothetical protein